MVFLTVSFTSRKKSEGRAASFSQIVSIGGLSEINYFFGKGRLNESEDVNNKSLVEVLVDDFERRGILFLFVEPSGSGNYCSGIVSNSCPIKEHSVYSSTTVYFID